MSLYADILDAVAARVRALESLEGVRVTVREQPSFLGLQDQLPQVVIASREDLAEQVVGMQMGGTVNLLFEVYVGIVVDRRWDSAHFRSRMQWREDVRLDLWEPLRLGLAGSGEWDVDYDPAPAGAEPSPPNTKGSWQRFDYTLTTTRAAEEEED